MQYYGTHLSENISRREPEGYLLCLNPFGTPRRREAADSCSSGSSGTGSPS